MIEGFSWYLSYIVVYFAIMFGIGFYYFMKVKSADDYLIGGWNMGFWPIVGTVISTWCGASVFIGTVGLAFNVGMSAYLRFSFASIFFTLLLIIGFGKCLRRQRLYTLADLFGQRFGPKVGIIPSILSAFIYAIPTTAMQYIAMNTIWTTIFGLDPTTGLILSTVLIFAFTVLGGLPGTIITDALQAIIIVTGIIILAVATVKFAGGFEHIIEVTPPEYLSPAGPFGYQEVFLYFLSVGPFYLMWQSSWQRIFAAKTEKISFRANVTAVLICSFILLMPCIIGVASRLFLPADINGDMIFSRVVKDLLPPYIGGFIYCALLAALVTGADSFILQGSSSLTHDLYRRLINPDATNKQILFVSRITVLFVALAAFIVAMYFSGILAIYQWVLRLTATTLVLPFLATMFVKRTTKTGVLCGMVGGLVSTLIWPLLGITFDQTIFGFLFSFLGLFFGSMLSKHSPEEFPAAVMWENLPCANAEPECNSVYADKLD